MGGHRSDRKVLIIEDNELSGKMLQDGLQRKSHFQPLWVKNLSDAIEILDKENIFVALVDYSLPDALHGEAIEETTRRNIPSIVFTGKVEENIRQKVWESFVVDYVLKDHVGSFHYLLNMLNRLEQNLNTAVMVVDDSRTFRSVLSRLLKIHLYQVIEAENGEQALKKLESNPRIKLVLSDYDMPEMDGFTLCFKIRERFSNNIAIIGISSADNPLMAARFIKNGANDFITKQSFITEEFYGRVTQCVNSIYQIEQIQEASIRDFMTNLHNRRYFFDTGKRLVTDAQNAVTPVVGAMIDIDHFKKVNDTWGHDVGDQVICAVSEIIHNRTREKDIVARLGGEEFGILSIDMDPMVIEDFFENLREQVEKKSIYSDSGDTIKFTVSMGVTITIGKSFEEILHLADELLYKAKNSGRNKVVIKDLR